MQSVYFDYEDPFPLAVLATQESGSQELCEELHKINGNTYIPGFYQALARDLDVLEPKLPDDVYKSHLVERRGADRPAVDSARQNMASSFVSGLVNAGFCRDKLVTEDNVEGQDGSKVKPNIHWSLLVLRLHTGQTWVEWRCSMLHEQQPQPHTCIWPFKAKCSSIPLSRKI